MVQTGLRINCADRELVVAAGIRLTAQRFLYTKAAEIRPHCAVISTAFIYFMNFLITVLKLSAVNHPDPFHGLGRIRFSSKSRETEKAFTVFTETASRCSDHMGFIE